MELNYSGFNWDFGNIGKCKKHGVSVEKIEELFNCKQVIIGPNPRTCSQELRYCAIGRISEKEYLYVIFTFRNYFERTLIRPISARFMHKKEIKRYEEAFAKIENR